MPPNWEPMFCGAAFPCSGRRLLVLQGAVPAELRGTLYRVGPDDGLCHGETLGNLFSDANGFVGAFHFGDSQVEFRANFVETPYYLAETAAGWRLFAGYATRPPGVHSTGSP